MRKKIYNPDTKQEEWVSMGPSRPSGYDNGDFSSDFVTTFLHLNHEIGEMNVARGGEYHNQLKRLGKRRLGASIYGLLSYLTLREKILNGGNKTKRKYRKSW